MSIALDQNRIAIRQRSLPEIMDLALLVSRQMGWRLLAATAIGALPMMLLNGLLLQEYAQPDYVLDEPMELPWTYFFFMAVALALEMPLATAPATLYLGLSMFDERPKLRRMIRDLWHSLPQLIWFQVAIRALLGFFWFLLLIPLIIPFVAWPYLNEVILLERNPLLAGREKRRTSFARSRMLHGTNSGELMARWLGSLGVGTLMIVSLFLATWTLAGQLAGSQIAESTAYVFILPICIWTVVAFFTVVRFLAYMDLRIRREGWEVELAHRAEAARLIGGGELAGQAP